MARLLVVARNRNFPALSGGAPLFDATLNVWVITPSTPTVDAGAAADLRHTHDETHTLGFSTPKPRPVVSAETTGRLHAVVEALKMAVGLTVFGLIAGVLLVMA